jgi:hypothetical protein
MERTGNLFNCSYIIYKIKHTPFLQNEADNPFRINKFFLKLMKKRRFCPAKPLTPLESVYYLHKGVQSTELAYSTRLPPTRDLRTPISERTAMPLPSFLRST